MIYDCIPVQRKEASLPELHDLIRFPLFDTRHFFPLFFFFVLAFLNVAGKFTPLQDEEVVPFNTFLPI